MSIENIQEKMLSCAEQLLADLLPITIENVGEARYRITQAYDISYKAAQELCIDGIIASQRVQ